MKLIENHWYKFNDRGEIHVGYYLGRSNGFGCCVCGKGTNAYIFNVWYAKEDFSIMNYETWGYGKEHLPEIIEDLGLRSGVIVDTFIK